MKRPAPYFKQIFSSAVHIHSSFESHTKFPDDTILLNTASAILLRLGHFPNRNARFVRQDQGKNPPLDFSPQATNFRALNSEI